MSNHRIMENTAVFGGEKDVLHFSHTYNGDLTISITDSTAGGFYLCSLNRDEMVALRDALSHWLRDRQINEVLGGK